MTKEETEKHLMIHAMHTVIDFIRAKDEAHAKEHPGMEMGAGWAADDATVWREFVEFQQRELDRITAGRTEVV